MLYFSIQHPDEYYPEYVSILCVSQNPNNIKEPLIFEIDSDTITLECGEDLDPYEIYSGSYGILKYTDKSKKDFRIFGMSRFDTVQDFAAYFDDKSIKEMKECKYYIKKDGKILSEEDITNKIKVAISE